MRKISDVLRLKAAGMSNRDIAAATAVSKTTVNEYLNRALAAGIAWPLPEGMDEDTLGRALFPSPGDLPGVRPVPEWLVVRREMKAKRHVTLRLLWLEWRESHPDGWGYSQFCWHYQRWLGTQDVVMRLDWAAGEAMFVDFSGDTASYVDPATGEVKQAEVFVAVTPRRMLK
jgi:transposase